MNSSRTRAPLHTFTLNDDEVQTLLCCLDELADDERFEPCEVLDVRNRIAAQLRWPE